MMSVRMAILFRSSRPDYIETGGGGYSGVGAGLLFRSSRPDYIETLLPYEGSNGWEVLFRSSRPDYIETSRSRASESLRPGIVPVFQAGLH